MVGILQCSSKTLITRDNWIASDISTHKSSKSSLHKEKSSVQKKGVDVVFARDWIETRFRGGGEGIRRFRFFLVELTLERRTGAVRSKETIHTAITARRQLDMVHSDRERIGNTMTTNLQKKSAMDEAEKKSIRVLDRSNTGSWTQLLIHFSGKVTEWNRITDNHQSDNDTSSSLGSLIQCYNKWLSLRKGSGRYAKLSKARNIHFL